MLLLRSVIFGGVGRLNFNYKLYYRVSGGLNLASLFFSKTYGRTAKVLGEGWLVGDIYSMLWDFMRRIWDQENSNEIDKTEEKCKTIKLSWISKERFAKPDKLIFEEVEETSWGGAVPSSVPAGVSYAN